MSFARPTLIVAGLTLVIGSLGLAAGCGQGAGADGASKEDLAQLRQEVSELTAATRALSSAVKSQDLRLARAENQRGRHVGNAAAPHGDDGVASPASGVDGAVATAMAAGSAGPDGEALDSETVTELLATEEGRKAIQKAADSAARQEARRGRDTLVAYELRRFGVEAGLSEEQTKSLQGIWKDTLTGVREFMAKSRKAKSGTPDEQARARESMMQSMRDFGAKRTERVRALLDEDQFARYEKRAPDIDAALHGAPPRPARSMGDDGERPATR